MRCTLLILSRCYWICIVLPLGFIGASFHFAYEKADSFGEKLFRRI